MVKDLITVIIPCKDCVYELKDTIENISNKTGIRGTSVLVLDFGSTDGTFQYSSQASSDMIKILKIESINMSGNKDMEEISNIIKTPYISIIKPGTVTEDKDLIIKSLNKVMKGNKSLIYFKKIGILDKIINRYKNKKSQIIIFSTPDNICNVEYNPINYNSISVNDLFRRNKNVIMDRI